MGDSGCEGHAQLLQGPVEPQSRVLSQSLEWARVISIQTKCSSLLSFLPPIFLHFFFFLFSQMKETTEVIEKPTITATAPALGALLHQVKHFSVHLLVDLLAPEEIEVDKFGDVLYVGNVGDPGQGDVHILRG